MLSPYAHKVQLHSLNVYQHLLKHKHRQHKVVASDMQRTQYQAMCVSTKASAWLRWIDFSELQDTVGLLFNSFCDRTRKNSFDYCSCCFDLLFPKWRWAKDLSTWEREAYGCWAPGAIYSQLCAKAAFVSFMHLSRSDVGSHLRCVFTLAVLAQSRQIKSKIKLQKIDNCGNGHKVIQEEFATLGCWTSMFSDEWKPF